MTQALRPLRGLTAVSGFVVATVVTTSLAGAQQSNPAAVIDDLALVVNVGLGLASASNSARL